MSTRNGGGIALPTSPHPSTTAIGGDASASPPGGRLPWKAKISYGAGDFAFGLCWNMVGAFLLYFYTDVALLPVGVVGTLFLLSRLLDAGIDPVVGVLVDRTRSRWGRTRPYFLYGAVPFGLFSVAVFYVPPLGDTGKLVWAGATFIILGLLFSIVNIPYSALLPMMTGRQEERVQVSSLRSAGTALSVIFATAGTMPLVTALGGGDKAQGFLLTALLAAGVSVALILNLFANCREVIHDGGEEPPATLSAISNMVRNRAWLVVFVFTTLNFIRFGAVLAVTAYFALNVLHQPWMISILLPAISGTLLIGSAIAPPYLRRFGMRQGNRLVLILATGLYLVLPLAEGQPWLFLTIYVLASVLISVTMTAIFAMAAETVDYHEARFGVRHEGLLSAGISLSTKIGMALGGAVIAYGLAWVDYNPAAVSDGAVHMVHALYYVPAVVVLLLQTLCISFYPAIPKRPQA
ncbi:MFS transporter [Nitrospirillum viridazoti]|uniref:MFS transporter n=1 Tax=Nitrospirillum viridazoti CBAmc TaxID=1441467 RepID=A0A248JQC2_9PROT|nr:glycoside-pentoside-hexuronide (GPH):cation symporter [Nitrospirillum amazonense]ASG20278.1 MFS transporter [Nitrospirillum amazonense CBAmc]TWB27962.1 GPH family glycoside/pentoside/hexuronide:cation symporter [Nitrospirillum amazonense]